MPAEPQISRRLFVVGAPRSGTTLVQSLLAAHSTMTSFTESHFFSRHVSLLPLLPTPLLTRNPAPRVRQFLAENGEGPCRASDWFAARVRGTLRWRVLLPFLTRPVARNFLAIFDQLAGRRGKVGWVEKTPRHLHSIPLIERVSSGLAGARFVHVIRRGLEVVASLHRASQHWQTPYDLETCVRRWNADVGFSLQRLRKPSQPPRDHWVFYEDLASHPETTLQRLLAELGLGWEPEILDTFAPTSVSLITPQEVWKEGVGRRIQRASTSQGVLSAEQRDQVNHSLQHALYDQLFEGVGLARVSPAPLNKAGGRAG